MTTLKELREDLDKMYGSIYSRSVDCFLDYQYLIKPNTNEELKIAEIDPFIINVKLLLVEKSILQVNKLFGCENDDYSFRKLLNKLLHNHKNSEWKNKISKEKIKEWQMKLNEESLLVLIKKINNYRSGYLAHTDRTPEPFENIMMNQEEMTNLYKICEDIFNEIRSSFVDNMKYGTCINKTRNANDILLKLDYFYITLEQNKK